MKGIYSIYKCVSCKRTNILLTDEVEEAIKGDRYLSCAYCNCKQLAKEKETDNAKECMNTSHYKRMKGAIRQVA